MVSSLIVVVLFVGLYAYASARHSSRFMELRGFRDTNPKRRVLTEDDFKGNYSRFMEISHSTMGQLCPRHIQVLSNGLLLPNKSVLILHSSLQLDNVPCTSSGSILFSYGSKLSSSLIRNVFGISFNQTGRFGEVLHHILSQVNGFYLGVENDNFKCARNSFEPGTAILFSSDSDVFGKELHVPFHGLPVIILVSDPKKSCAYSGPWLTSTHLPRPLNNASHSHGMNDSANSQQTSSGKPPKSSSGSGYDEQMHEGHTGDVPPSSTKAPRISTTGTSTTPSPIAVKSTTPSMPAEKTVPSGAPKPSNATTTGIPFVTTASNTQPTGAQSAAPSNHPSNGITYIPNPHQIDSSLTTNPMPTGGTLATTAAPSTGSSTKIPSSTARGIITAVTPTSVVMTTSPMTANPPMSAATINPNFSTVTAATATPKPTSLATTTYPIPQQTGTTISATVPTTSGTSVTANAIPPTGVATSTHPIPTGSNAGLPIPISANGGQAMINPHPSAAAKVTSHPTSSVIATGAPQQAIPQRTVPIVPKEIGGIISSPPESSNLLPQVTTSSPRPSSILGTGQVGVGFGSAPTVNDGNGKKIPSGSNADLTFTSSDEQGEGGPLAPEASAEDAFNATPRPQSTGPFTTSSNTSTDPLLLQSSTISPTPTPSKNPKLTLNFSCLPGDAQVLLQSGERLKVSQLMTGDFVHVGKGVFSPVIGFTHSNQWVTSIFVELTTKSGHVVSATPTHYMHCNRGLLPARELLPNDKLVLADGMTSTIVKRRMIYKNGLYNPQTADGNVDIDGILVSTYTSAVKPEVAHSLLAPFRLMHALNVSTLKICDVSHMIGLVADISRWVLS